MVTWSGGFELMVAYYVIAGTRGRVAHSPHGLQEANGERERQERLEFQFMFPVTKCTSYFSVAVTKHRNQGNNRRKSLFRFIAAEG